MIAVVSLLRVLVRMSLWRKQVMLSSARVRTNVVLAVKCDSRRQSTTSFSENVVVAKTGY